MQARFVCETHDVPDGENLLRERLLEEEYREALDRVTDRLRSEEPPPIPPPPQTLQPSSGTVSVQTASAGSFLCNTAPILQPSGMVPVRTAGGLTLVLIRAPDRFLPLLRRITQDLIPQISFKGQAPLIPDVIAHLRQEPRPQLSAPRGREQSPRAGACRVSQ